MIFRSLSAFLLTLSLLCSLCANDVVLTDVALTSNTHFLSKEKVLEEPQNPQAKLLKAVLNVKAIAMPYNAI